MCERRGQGGQHINLRLLACHLGGNEEQMNLCEFWRIELQCAYIRRSLAPFGLARPRRACNCDWHPLLSTICFTTHRQTHATAPRRLSSARAAQQFCELALPIDGPLGARQAITTSGSVLDIIHPLSASASFLAIRFSPKRHRSSDTPLLSLPP